MEEEEDGKEDEEVWKEESVSLQSFPEYPGSQMQIKDGEQYPWEEHEFGQVSWVQWGPVYDGMQWQILFMQVP